jgi:hypothetical protein
MDFWWNILAEWQADFFALRMAADSVVKRSASQLSHLVQSLSLADSVAHRPFTPKKKEISPAHILVLKFICLSEGSQKNGRNERKNKSDIFVTTFKNTKAIL